MINLNHPGWHLQPQPSGAPIDLIDSLARIAREEYPDLEPGHCQQLFEVHVARLAQATSGIVDVQARLHALSRYLYEDAGFAGNDEDFLDPRNYFLNDILERRLGSPTGLGIVVMELARRVDIPLSGISLPWEFLLRLDLEDGMLVLDPFRRGHSLDKPELQELAREHLQLEDVDDRQLARMLKPASQREILARVLRNLALIHSRNEQVEKALHCLSRVENLLPDDADALLDRGLLYHEIGHFSAARSDLLRFLRLTPQSPNHEMVQDLLIEGGSHITPLH